MNNAPKSSPQTIELRITLPKPRGGRTLRELRSNFARLSSWKQVISVGAIGLLIAIPLYGATSLIHPADSDTLGESTSTGKKPFPSKVQRTPDYPTILPSGKTIESLGGWTRVSPPEKNAVFAYVDTINDNKINVSQQPLPSEFKEDTNAQVEQLATGYGALEHVTVGDTTVFIGTSAKGPQSVIFAKNNVLVLIKSSIPHSQDQWAQYVSSLQ